jgi:putative Mn2+ efflux pump MntP
MIWTPEPWLGFILIVGVGIMFMLLGLIPLLPGYKQARIDDPTHWLSYVGRVIVGITVIALGCMRYLR